MPTKKPHKNKKINDVLDFGPYFGKGILAFTTLKSIDFKLKEGDTTLTSKQKIFLKKKIGIPMEHFPVVRQVHGRRIIAVKRQSCLTSFLEKADGFITNKENIPLSVRTADCLSIFLYDPKRHAIGLVHAGWRGSQKHIVENAVRLMQKNYKTNPRNLKVVFGPSIGECCYAVGPEFKKYFAKETFLRKNKLYLDLPLVNKRQLLKAGVKQRNIFDAGTCTFCDGKYFSYRREGEKAGRMLSLMMLTSPRKS